MYLSHFPGSVKYLILRFFFVVTLRWIPFLWNIHTYYYLRIHVCRILSYLWFYAYRRHFLAGLGLLGLDSRQISIYIPGKFILSLTMDCMGWAGEWWVGSGGLVGAPDDCQIKQRPPHTQQAKNGKNRHKYLKNSFHPVGLFSVTPFNGISKNNFFSLWGKQCNFSKLHFYYYYF